VAEEKHDQHLDEFITPNTDDMSVLNTLLRTIKGISPVSGNPMNLDYMLDDDEVV
jgi:hypothetical protein